MTVSRVERWLWWAVAVGAAFAAVRLAQTSAFALDEIQHLHVAWNLHEGRWPYRDFYEHHGLVLTALDALVLSLRGDAAATFDTLAWLRGVSLAGLAGQGLVLWRLARASSDAPGAGPMAPALLLASALVTEFGPQVRPDTLQTLFVLLGALGLLKRRPGQGGLWLGLALAAHPKSVAAVAAVVGAALVAGWPWDRLLLRRWGARVAGGLALPTALVGALYAVLGGFDAWLDAGLVSNVRLLVDRWGNGRLHPHVERWLWTHDAPMTGLLVLGAGLLAVRSRRHKPMPDGLRFVLVAAALLTPLVVVPLYPQLLLVVVPFFALAAAHGLRPAGWRWSALGVAAVVVGMRLTQLPSGESPERLAQRSMVDWMLTHASREEPVVEVWPTDCPAFVFQRDPAWQWMLASNDTYAPGGTPTSGLLDRVLREQVLAGRVDHVAFDAASEPFLMPDIRAFLKERFEPNGCVWSRRRDDSAHDGHVAPAGE